MNWCSHVYFDYRHYAPDVVLHEDNDNDVDCSYIMMAVDIAAAVGYYSRKVILQALNKDYNGEDKDKELILVWLLVVQKHRLPVWCYRML